LSANWAASFSAAGSRPENSRRQVRCSLLRANGGAVFRARHKPGPAPRIWADRRRSIESACWYGLSEPRWTSAIILCGAGFGAGTMSEQAIGIQAAGGKGACPSRPGPRPSKSPVVIGPIDALGQIENGARRNRTSGFVDSSRRNRRWFGDDHTGRPRDFESGSLVGRGARPSACGFASGEARRE